MIAAILVLGLAVVAVAALMSAASADGRRTLERHQRAQLDQMLLAGASEARMHLKDAGPKPGDSWKPQLPAALREQDAGVETKVESAGDADHAVVHITARIANRSAEQVVTFERTSGSWKVASANIPAE
jgi:hypothetical protein